MVALVGGSLPTAVAAAEAPNACRVPGHIFTESGWHFALSNGDDFAPGLSLELTAVNGLTELARELTARGITVVPVVIPARIAAEHDMVDDPSQIPPGEVERATREYDQLVQFLNLIGFPTPNLLRRISLSEPMFFARDHHWRPRGAREAALIVADTVASLGLDYQPAEFVTEMVGKRLNVGRDAEIRTLCPNIELIEQFYPLFKTTRAQAPQDLAAALFATDPRHGVLVGTSNSRSEFNFAGALEESLGLPIENHHIEAGGPFDSLHSYLLSESYHDHDPLLVIWEFSVAELTPAARGILGVNREDTYRQLLPAVRRACSSGEERTTKVVDRAAVDLSTLFHGPASALVGQRVSFAPSGAGADGATRLSVERPYRIGRLSYELKTEAPLGGQQLSVAATMRGAGGRVGVYLTGPATALPLTESRVITLDQGSTLVRLAEVFPLWETARRAIVNVDLLDAGVEYEIDTITVTSNGPTPLFPGQRARLGEGGVLCLDFDDRRLDHLTLKVETDRGATSLLEFHHSKYAPFVGTAMFDLAPDRGVKALSVFLPFEPSGPLTARLVAPSDRRGAPAGKEPEATTPRSGE